MATITSSSTGRSSGQQANALRSSGPIHAPAGAASVPHKTAGTDPTDNDESLKRFEHGGAMGDSAPVVSSFDDDEQAAPPKLGYKDELEVRYIWDRVLGKGRNGSSVRVVIDRFTGTEYACKKIPKEAPAEVLPENATQEQIDEANRTQLEHIKRDITILSDVRSSLNFVKLEQVYEDKKNVYVVVEKCEGKTVEELLRENGPLPGNQVSRIMRSVVRTIAQVHDAGHTHGAVEPGKFMLLSEDRGSPVKCTGFGRLNPTGAGAGKITGDIASMAPEMLSQNQTIGKNADTWAAGIMATRLLTEYFPFDDVLSNAVDSFGVLQPIAPLTELLDNNPLMPSAAAIFVSAIVCLLDFSRPKWQPVASQAKDWVLKSLSLDPESRWSPLDALEHPWLKREKTSKADDAPTGVIQRMQRFGGFTDFKRAALEQMAQRIFRQSQEFVDHSQTGFISNTTSLDPADLPEKERAPNPDDTQALNFSRPKAPSAVVKASAAMGAARINDKLQGKGPGGPDSMKQAKGLLEHLLVDNGTIDRFSLAEGLAQLGYKVSESDLDHLLGQLLAVPGLTTSTAVTSTSVAASQLEASDEEAWTEMARAAFDALDLDGDGSVQRSEMEVVLAGRCPDSEIESAIEQAMIEAGLPPDAQCLDYAAFLRLLNADMGIDDNPAGRGRIEKFASMRDATASLSGLLRGELRDACNSCSIRLKVAGGRAGSIEHDRLDGGDGGGRRTLYAIPSGDGDTSGLLMQLPPTLSQEMASTGQLGTVQEEFAAAAGSSGNVFVPSPYMYVPPPGGGGGNGGNGGGNVGGGYGDSGGADEPSWRGEFRRLARPGKGKGKLEPMLSAEGSNIAQQGSVETVPSFASR